jgi:hypothetical protein
MEVAMVQRGDRRLSETFGDGDDRGVDHIEGEIGVGAEQFEDTVPVLGRQIERLGGRW